MVSLYGLLNCEIGALDCRVITTEHSSRVHCIHMLHLFCNALFYVIYSGVSGQCPYTMHDKERFVQYLAFIMTPTIQKCYESVYYFDVLSTLFACTFGSLNKLFALLVPTFQKQNYLNFE